MIYAAPRKSFRSWCGVVGEGLGLGNEVVEGRNLSLVGVGGREVGLREASSGEIEREGGVEVGS